MVRPKEYTESEQIAILHAVLLNKDILEAPKAKNRTRTEAWRVKWEEIAATTDAYFGTNRGATRVRSLYTHWKTAAKRKHSSIQKTLLSERDYEASLTMAERILRQICPDIFRKFDGEPTTSNNRGTNNATNPESSKGADEPSDEVTDEEEQSEPQPPVNSNNGYPMLRMDIARLIYRLASSKCWNDFFSPEENASLPENKEIETSEATGDVDKKSEDLEELIERAVPNVETKNELNTELPVLGNSDLDGLVLSLQSIIDIPSEIETAVANDPAIFESNQKMDDDIGEIVEAIKEYVHEKSMNDANGTSEMKNEDAGPSLNENEAMKTEEPLDLTKEEVSAKNIIVTSTDDSKPNEVLEKMEELVSTVDEDGKTDEKEIEETKMEIDENTEVSDEKKAENNPENLSEPPVKPEFIPEINENSEDTKDPLPESSVNVAVVEKRKKKQRGRVTKKRKVA